MVDDLCGDCVHYPLCHAIWHVDAAHPCRFIGGGNVDYFRHKNRLTTLKEGEKKAIRLCEDIWQRQWSNPEDCLADAVDLMKLLNPDHPMVKATTFREDIAAKKDSYIAIRKENERLDEAVRIAITAIESLPQEALGRDSFVGHFYRDELVDKLKAALDQEKTEGDGSD